MKYSLFVLLGSAMIVGGLTLFEKDSTLVSSATMHTHFASADSSAIDSELEQRNDNSATSSNSRDSNAPHHMHGSQSTSTATTATSEYAELLAQLQIMTATEGPHAAMDLLAEHLDHAEIANNCHSIVHTIGHTAYFTLGFDEAMQMQSDTCGSGYIHGVIEKRLAAADNMLLELPTICQPGDGHCFHGVGHGLMYFTRNDLPGSLQMCDTLSTASDKTRCAEGVFMENTNADPVAHPSKYLREDDAIYPCPEQDEFYKNPCYFYAPRYFFRLHTDAFDDAFTWCTTSAETDHIDDCIRGIGSAIMKYHITQPLMMESVCMRADGEYVDDCIRGMTSYYIVHHSSVEPARAMCEKLEDPANQSACRATVSANQQLFAD